jgi:hypothetical protein
LNKHSATPSVIGNVAAGLDDVLGEVRASLTGDEYRQAATLVRSHIAHAAQALFELQGFAGTLDGLAWAVDAKHRADTAFVPEPRFHFLRTFRVGTRLSPEASGVVGGTKSSESCTRSFWATWTAVRTVMFCRPPSISWT